MNAVAFMQHYITTNIQQWTNGRTKFICQWTEWTMTGYQLRPKPIKVGHQKYKNKKVTN